MSYHTSGYQLKIPYNGKQTSFMMEYKMTDAVRDANFLTPDGKRINFSGGLIVREILDGDLNSPTYGSPLKVQIQIGKNAGLSSEWVDVPPNSELGQIIAGDPYGDRTKRYQRALGQMREGVFFSKNQVAQHDAAITANGLYDLWDGTATVSDAEIATALPSVDVTNFVSSVDDDTDKEEVKDEDVNVKKKKFFGGVALQYPAGAHYAEAEGGPSQDYMKFDMFQYSPPQASYASKYFEQEPLDVKEKGVKEGQSGRFNTTFTETLTGGLARSSTIRDYLGTVKLPIPNQLSTGNGVSWGEGRANAFEAAAFLGAFGQLRETVAGNQNLLNVFQNAGTEFGNLFNAFKDGAGGDANTLISSTATKAALAQLNINTDPNQFITRATGKAINPNLELLFAGPKLRSFQFTFQFAPVNELDAKRTRQIMRFFKQGMLPNRGTKSDLFLLSPNVFRLAFMNGSKRIKSLNSFKICALTTCAINFAPDGVYQAYDDPNAISQPVRSQMTLGFSELTPIFGDDYDTKDTGARADILELQKGITERGPLDEWFDDSSIDGGGNDIGF